MLIITDSVENSITAPLDTIFGSKIIPLFLYVTLNYRESRAS